MIDAHTHVLPAMDDGSKDAEMSAKMLRLLKRQGADTVLATPHFYADRDDPQRFLERRERAFTLLREYVRQMPVPSMRLGAEVYWFPGMGRTEALDQFRIEGTRLILVEMPFAEWSDGMIRELREIQQRGMYPVLAHVDRYACFRHKKDLIELRDSGLYMQVNADVMDSWFSARRAQWMLKEQVIQFLGTDCHNMDERKPNLKKAVQKLCDACGEQLWDDFVAISDSLIGGE